MNKKCPTPYPGGTCGCGQGCETDMVEFRKMNAHLLPPENANSKQIGGDHYQAPIQHWDIVAMHDLDYFQGQITKYVMRWRKKGGIEDLKKARHFLDKYIEIHEQDKRNARQNIREIMRTRVGNDDPIDGSHSK